MTRCSRSSSTSRTGREGVPLFVVATARPELFERHPDFAAGLPSANRINLAPLSADETARLVSGLLGATVSPELAGSILERAEGNPLYAEEFVRLLRDRDLLAESGGAVALRPGVSVALPDSIQALIAARLDTLSPERKSMLADAAVVGKVFWAGAVAAMGNRDLAAVTGAMRDLSRKELVRSARRSSIEGEAEYAFWHVLARDVAYGSLPRASRAARHVAAARWIESKAADRLEDLADILAHHYATALDLARAAGQRAQAAELEAPAFRFLSLAGERALGLDTAAALADLERALALAPPGHPDRAAALARFGEAAFQAGRYGDARTALEEAVDLFNERGDIPAAARTMGKLAAVLLRLGDPRAFALPAEALALLEPLGPSPDLVAALTEVARADGLAARSEAAVRSADRALALAADLGLARPARALGYRALARAEIGDPGGLADYRAAIALAVEAGQGREVAQLQSNLAEHLALFEGPAAAFAIWRAAIAYAEARGLTETVDGLSASLLDPSLGEFDEALALAAVLAPRLDAGGDLFGLAKLRANEAIVRAHRGEASLAAPWLDWLVSAVRATEDPQIVVDGLASGASARAALGQDEAAARLLAEVETYPGARGDTNYDKHLPLMVRTALAIGDSVLAERLVEGFAARNPYGEHALVAANAMLAEAGGDSAAAFLAYADAAVRWERFGVVPERAFALLGQGRCLLALGRPGEARGPLGEARAIFARLGAAPALGETDALLASVGAS